VPVAELTDLVGRMPLKDIVRESTDLIERLCIEAALDQADDNRASAAGMLGLSRQSLYTKLHRHGLGNLGLGNPGTGHAADGPGAEGSGEHGSD
jgi:DNA-binding NtrC family response regulator